MTTEQFTYWLQGFAELQSEPPTAEQWRSIRDHLALVFDKRTPSLSPGTFAPYYPSQTATPQRALLSETIC